MIKTDGNAPYSLTTAELDRVAGSLGSNGPQAQQNIAGAPLRTTISDVVKTLGDALRSVARSG